MGTHTKSMARGQVLVVEDDHDLQWTLLDALWELGYAAVRAQDGLDALEIARGETPCAILLDLAMPLMRGEEFLQLLQRDSTLREVPVIILSGEPNAKAIADQYKLGFLAKPVELHQLQKVMSFIVDGGLERATKLPGAPRP